MSFFGRLFGTEKAISDITDKENGLVAKAGGWFDRQQFTEEERAEHRHQIRLWGLKQLEALQPFKVVQRILAFAIVTLWILVGLNVIASIWFAEEATRDAMLKFAFSDYVFWPVTVCFALYFGGGLFESIKRTGKDK